MDAKYYNGAPGEMPYDDPVPSVRRDLEPLPVCADCHEEIPGTMHGVIAHDGVGRVYCHTDYVWRCDRLAGVDARSRAEIQRAGAGGGGRRAGRTTTSR